MAVENKSLYTAMELIHRLKISDKYLRRILTQLAKAGLINSFQGRNGGYSFAKPVREIYLIDIINAVENFDRYMGCVLGFDECSDANPCAIHKQWAGIRDQIYQMFKDTSLDEISKSPITKM
jgi:Rrf2 family protein